MKTMNLLEQYKKLQRENLSKNGDMQLGIAYKKENGLTTVKYLHGELILAILCIETLVG